VEGLDCHAAAHFIKFSTSKIGGGSDAKLSYGIHALTGYGAAMPAGRGLGPPVALEQLLAPRLLRVLTIANFVPCAALALGNIVPVTELGDNPFEIAPADKVEQAEPFFSTWSRYFTLEVGGAPDSSRLNSALRSIKALLRKSWPSRARMSNVKKQGSARWKSSSLN
jgi:hypothetical protein